MFEILSETPHWIAVNKPSGLNVEQLWDYPSVEQQVRDYLTVAGRKPPYLGIVHRLDRPVSGVLLLAKKKSSLKALNEQFAQREVRKVYWAVTAAYPQPEAGTLVHYLFKNQQDKRAEAYAKAAKGRIRAELSYQLLGTEAEKESGRVGGARLLEIRPITGKFHQIRVQLAAIDCPIVGDVKYGAVARDNPLEIALHARTLYFRDPFSKEEVSISAQLPSTKIWQTGGNNK